ncbi:MAG: hypothetical protein J5486_08750 [Bacteroidaceae bacterium]|nr:hypothetical protein [Bacteroidaceae bacterium]
MDYKYIEQLIERYLQCETTIHEERILREFFAQDDVPTHLKQWQSLFAAQHELSQAHLDADFNKRIMELTSTRVVTPRRITLYQRMRPLFRAAAIVAFAIVIGTVMNNPGNVSSESQSDMAHAEFVLESTTSAHPETYSAELVESAADSTSFIKVQTQEDMPMP